MIKDKEKIVQEKTEKIACQIKMYVDDIDSLSETNEFKIDSIERKWGELEEHTKRVYRELNDEIVRQYNEKGIIKSKKGSTQNGG